MNANNQLLSVENTRDEGRQTNYQYDALGNQIRVDKPNGTYSEYTYNPYRNWLTSVINRNSDDTVLSSFDYYTYDNVGNRTQMTENSGQMTEATINYTYDDIYQLTSETRVGTNPYSISYTYDDVGNRLTRLRQDYGGQAETAYIYNANNQLFTETVDSDTTTLYSYDNNGNLISKTDGLNTTLYEWDWRNLLVQISNNQFLISNEYDGDGNRIAKTVDGVKTNYINDVGLGLVQVIMETNEAGKLQKTYTYGNDLISINNEQLAINNYYHYDRLGSVRQLTDDTETVVAEYTYDAFGNLIAQTGSGENSYGFTGEQQFGEADDLVYLRARYYDPRIGRFISRDPILEPMYRKNKFRWYLDYFMNRPKSLHSYVYVTNNPINKVDREGLSEQKPGCDGVPDWLETRCRKQCCWLHDRCFEIFNCTIESWDPCKDPNPCFNICNRGVVLCFLLCPFPEFE